LNTYVAGKLKKVGGGQPTRQSVRELFEKMDEDTEWFPGKSTQEDFGPAKHLVGAVRATVARSAMTMKKAGVEPTYVNILAACPKATWNSKTKRPLSKGPIYDIFENDCYDEDVENPWRHKARYSKVALTPAMEAKRWDYSKLVLSWGHTEAWYFKRVIWTDICNSILPLTETKANEQALARKGKRGWGSDGCELHSQNLRGKAEALKQKSWDTMKVWWAPILCRGKLHVELLDSEFPGEVPEGARQLVEKVRAAVNIRFQQEATKPDMVMVDRGRGFWTPNSGKITPEFKAALREQGLRTVMGEDAVKQPGQLQEVLLHETAVSWLRCRLGRSAPAQSWLETREQYGARLKRCCDEINKDLDVDDLCRAFPKRCKLLDDAEGGRLRH
jgi:hypothetical protein